MGYYTRFDIEIKTPMTREQAEQIANRLNTIMDYEDCFEVADSSLYAIWNLEPFDELKWYDWEKDMSQLANEFPDVEFRVEGNGEDREDWWIALFKGERKQIKYCSPPSDRWDD